MISFVLHFAKENKKNNIHKKLKKLRTTKTKIKLQMDVFIFPEIAFMINAQLFS